MKTVILHGKSAGGRVAVVDDADYEFVVRYRWYALEPSPGKIYASTRYQIAGAGRANVTMHQLLTGFPETDHRDNDGLNNQRSNLRPATRSQNNANRRKGAGFSSRFKGVSWAKREGKWDARIKSGGRQRYLGLFESEEAAARSYDAAATELFGEFACLNFPVSEGTP